MYNFFKINDFKIYNKNKKFDKNGELNFNFKNKNCAMDNGKNIYSSNLGFELVDDSSIIDKIESSQITNILNYIVKLRMLFCKNLKPYYIKDQILNDINIMIPMVNININTKTMIKLLLKKIYDINLSINNLEKDNNKYFDEIASFKDIIVKIFRKNIEINDNINDLLKNNDNNLINSNDIVVNENNKVIDEIINDKPHDNYTNTDFIKNKKLKLNNYDININLNLNNFNDKNININLNNNNIRDKNINININVNIKNSIKLNDEINNILNDKIICNKHDDKVICDKYNDKVISDKYDDKVICNKHDDKVIYDKHDNKVISDKHDDKVISDKYNDKIINNKYNNKIFCNNKVISDKYNDKVINNKYDNKYDNKIFCNNKVIIDKYNDNVISDKYNKIIYNKYENNIILKFLSEFNFVRKKLNAYLKNSPYDFKNYIKYKPLKIFEIINHKKPPDIKKYIKNIGKVILWQNMMNILHYKIPPDKI